MEGTIENQKPVPLEINNTYRVEHLPGLDVVVNSDYPNQKDQDDLLDILRSNPLNKDTNIEHYLLLKIISLKDGKNRRFYLKVKRNIKEQVDFVQGRVKRDPLLNVARDFNHRSRYALAGVLSEIVLSKKIKEIVASNEVQELAKKYGFAGMQFSEPMIALINRMDSKKYLIYKNIKESTGLFNTTYDFISIAENLRKIFLRNSIHPHDLHPSQFMMTEQDDKLCIVLIDIEAYTEVNKPTTP